MLIVKEGQLNVGEDRKIEFIRCYTVLHIVYIIQYQEIIKNTSSEYLSIFILEPALLIFVYII